MENRNPSSKKAGIPRMAHRMSQKRKDRGIVNVAGPYWALLLRLLLRRRLLWRCSFILLRAQEYILLRPRSLLSSVRDERKARVVTRRGCFDSGSFGRYCVPNGQENACCGFSGDNVASGINCLGDGRAGELMCVPFQYDTEFGTVSTCHVAHYPFQEPPRVEQWAKKGSCNVNTGEPADVLLEITCDHTPAGLECYGGEE